jgi:hypothetical protein
MPRVTRNFWIVVDIDGRRTRLEGGPQGRSGEFTATIYIRDNGSVLRAVALSGRAMSDGTLTISAAPAGDVAHSQTGRVENDGYAFSVATQAGYKPLPNRPASARLTRELLRTLPPDPDTYEPYTEPPCPYLANDVPTREDCAVNGCTSCRAVIEDEAKRAAANPLGCDTFGRPYNT